MVTMNKEHTRIVKEWRRLEAKRNVELIKFGKADEAKQEKANKKRKETFDKIYSKYQKRLDKLDEEYKTVG